MELVDGVLWIAVLLFLTGTAIRSQTTRTRFSHALHSSGWVVFSGYWVLMTPYFAFEMHSAIETVLAVVAVPACGYVAYVIYTGSPTDAGQDLRSALQPLSESVGYMGLIYLTFSTIPVLRKWLIETVTRQTYVVMKATGYTAEVRAGPDYGYQSAFVFTDATGHEYITYIELACTGLGSIAIFVGLLAAVSAPLKRKLVVATAISSVIYLLNIVRNWFIAIAFGEQWFQQFAPYVVSLVGYGDPRMTSFFVADRVLAQFGSLIALLVLGYGALYAVPQLTTIAEAVVYVLFREDIDIDIE